MEFAKAKPNINFPVGRWVSEGGIWEIGFCPVLYGIRVRFGKVGSASVVLDYCAGDDKLFALELLGTMMQILSVFPESTAKQEISRLFPSFTIKPINQDPSCWERLKKLADEIRKIQRLDREYSTGALNEFPTKNT